jgi:hypothetical protein
MGRGSPPFRVVGAGLGRTGTLSLKLALEKLLGAPCYHMMEVFAHPEHVEPWQRAARGEMPDWRALMDGYGAGVDWPAGAYWQEMSEAFPEAIILLSVRDLDAWWESADQTIFPNLRKPPPADPPFFADWHAMVLDMMAARFTVSLDDREACIEAARRHNDHVRATASPERLLEWSPGDGWEPLCRALDLPVPDEPFPHRNSREEFQARRVAADEETGSGD